MVRLWLNCRRDGCRRPPAGRNGYAPFLPVDVPRRAHTSRAHGRRSTAQLPQEWELLRYPAMSSHPLAARIGGSHERLFPISMSNLGGSSKPWRIVDLAIEV